MKTLSKIELKKINGGHNGEAYEAGKAVGNALEFASYFIGGGGAIKWIKKVL